MNYPAIHSYYKISELSYDFNIFNHVSFYYSRAGNRSSDTTVFALPKVRKITTWGSYFYRTVENANYVSGKGINLLQNPSTVKKTSRNTVIQQTDGF